MNSQTVYVLEDNSQIEEQKVGNIVPVPPVLPITFMDEIKKVQKENNEIAEGLEIVDKNDSNKIVQIFKKAVEAVGVQSTKQLILNTLVRANRAAVASTYQKYHVVDGVQHYNHLSLVKTIIVTAVDQYFSIERKNTFCFPDSLNDPESIVMIDLEDGKSSDPIPSWLGGHITDAVEDCRLGRDLTGGFFIQAYEQVTKLLCCDDFITVKNLITPISVRDKRASYVSFIYKIGSFLDIECCTTYEGVSFNVPIGGYYFHTWDQFDDLQIRDCYLLDVVRKLIHKCQQRYDAGKSYWGVADMQNQYWAQRQELTNSVKPNLQRHVDNGIDDLFKTTHLNNVKLQERGRPKNMTWPSQINYTGGNWGLYTFYVIEVTGIKDPRKDRAQHEKLTRFLAANKGAKVVKCGYTNNPQRRAAELEAKYVLGKTLRMEIYPCNEQSLEDAWHHGFNIYSGLPLKTHSLLYGTDYEQDVSELACAREFKIADTEMYHDCPAFRVKLEKFLNMISTKTGHPTRINH